ncbi:MAG TPA: helix-turn-helix domain-containing GNAT family N-acetyltransferase [Sphingomicrobium sp.]|nr:helix-turn-helix domain-containing GNAT family N-acetyltransferase [Sphingomicrobium sp.]
MVDRDDAVSSLRAFNRLYTNQLGLLDSHLDGSPFTLSEARVLYELAQRSESTAAEIGRCLKMDRAQISRTLKRFTRQELVAGRADPSHGRQRLLSLTPSGRAAFEDLNARTDSAISGFLSKLGAGRSGRLVEAARSMAEVLDARSNASPITLRGLRIGDLGLVTARQAILYAEEYGWNQDYEALVAQILSDFHRDFDAARDAAWIAELGGQMVGSIFLVRGNSPDIAKLRLLYVEPHARGAGVGALLVRTCIERAKVLGYARLTLWTNSVLTSARRLYERFGFALDDERPHHSFGHDLIGQNWSLSLGD